MDESIAGDEVERMDLEAWTKRTEARQNGQSRSLQELRLDVS